MSSPKIPVTFEFFKKYTYHDECVDFMLKSKANGDIKTYEKLISSNGSKEKALRFYYEAFYLNPKIREKHHIRLKAIPKRIKDKLLAIPVLDPTVEDGNASGLNKSTRHDASSSKRSKKETSNELPKSSVYITANEIADEELVVDDDEEPLSSPNSSTNTEKIESIGMQGNQQLLTPPSTASKNQETLNGRHQENSNSSSNKLEQNDAVYPSTAINNNNNSLYLICKDLVPYIHCCPLTYKEFCAYSNINELVKEFCKIKQYPAKRQRKVSDCFYILFYLSPEHRKMPPINNIRLIDNCPLEIKNKFFTVPTKLYLFDTNLNKTQEFTESTETNNSSEKVKEVAELKQVSTPTKMNTEESAVIISKKKETNETQQTTIKASDKHANDIPSNIIQKPTNFTTSEKTAATIPVSLNDFKTCTHYQEIIDKLLITKTQDNVKLLHRYRNSQEALDLILNNYYQAFYLVPTIRKIFPIRFKAIPCYMKNRLLQIPSGVNESSDTDFRIGELVPDFKDLAESQTDAPTSREEKKIEEILGKDEAPNNSNLTSSPNSALTIKTEKTAESKESVNKSKSPPGCSKRPPNTDVSMPSPKRQKNQQQTPDHVDNTESNKKSYKELLPYAHCCPVTFTEFKTYTNISKLFMKYCQKRYNSYKKLPYMLHRAYVLYYLSPESRQLNPFNILKILPECPEHLKSKIYEIPTNLYLQNEIKSEIKEELLEEGNPIASTTNEHRVASANPQQARENKTNSGKSTIEILENLLLQPAALTANLNFGSQCPNNNCVFHHVSPLDFIQLSNILNILPQPHDIAVVQQIFKKFLYKMIKEQNGDENIMVNSNFFCKLMKHKDICGKCDIDIQTLFKLDTTVSSHESEKARFSDTSNETIIEKQIENNRGMQSNSNDAKNELKTNKQQEIIEGSITKVKENITTDSQNQQNCFAKPPLENWKLLNTDKVFKKFRQKLVEKLNKSVEENVDFCSNTCEIFLECNKIPLRKLLNDFCENNEDIVQRILNDSGLCKALKRYFCCKYLTNGKFALKYPVQIKQTNENNSQTSIESQTNNTTIKTLEKGDSNTKSLHKETADTSKEREKDPNKTELANKTNDIEKAKRTFFRNVDKTHTLSYVLRTSFGLKQLILQTILTLTFNEFLHLTNIHDGYELYNDNHTTECMYHYVFRTPLVWPTNLYITLKNLLDLLHKKNIRFNDYATMLTHISPKILHWSCLLSCTNIVDCVKIDYEQRMGKKLNSNDIISINHECMEYYNRCWKHEKWMGEVPRVNENFYKDYEIMNEQGDVTMLDESLLQEICEVPIVAGSNIVLDNNSRDEIASITETEVHSQQTTVSNSLEERAPSAADEVYVETIEDMDITTNSNQSIKEFNCLILPNTQQQIEMLPTEVRVFNDPLNNSNCPNNLNVSTSISEEDNDIISVGEINLSVKAEPIADKLLNNLIFYEDENSNIQNIPCAEEIIDLDESVAHDGLENLIPSQIDCEVGTADIIQSHDLISSNDSNSLINLGQQLPSSGETVCSQQHQNLATTSTLFPQLPYVILQSSGDNESPEHQLQEHHLEEEHLEEQHLEEQHLEEQHLEEQHLEEQHLEGQHLEEQHLEEQHLEKQHLEGQHLEEQQIGNVLNNSMEKQNLLETCPTSTLQSFMTFPEAQNFPSTFEDLLTFTGNINAQPESYSLPQEENIIPTQTEDAEDAALTLLHATHQENTNITKSSNIILPEESNTLESLNVENKSVSIVGSDSLCKNFLIVRRPQTNIAKVRPLKNSDFVPQIQHNTRPLLTRPAYTSDKRDNKHHKELTQQTATPLNIETVETTTDVVSLTHPETNLLNTPAEQNSRLQFQLSPLGTHIYVSQDFNNSSVFNDTSLLRIVDHNYHKGNATSSLTTSEIQTESTEDFPMNPTPNASNQQTSRRVIRNNNLSFTGNTSLNLNQQPVRRSTRRNSLCPSNEINQPASPRRITRSLYKDTNDKNFFVCIKK